MSTCNCLNIEVDGNEYDTCLGYGIETFREVCQDCGSVTYGYAVTTEDGEEVDSDGGFATREEAYAAATEDLDAPPGYEGMDANDYEFERALDAMFREERGL